MAPGLGFKCGSPVPPDERKPNCRAREKLTPKPKLPETDTRLETSPTTRLEGSRSQGDREAKIGAEKVNFFFGTGRDRTGKDTGQSWAELGQSLEKKVWFLVPVWSRGLTRTRKGGYSSVLSKKEYHVMNGKWAMGKWEGGDRQLSHRKRKVASCKRKQAT